MYGTMAIAVWRAQEVDSMAAELRRRTVVALIIALIVTAIAMATVRLTIAMATLMFFYFSATCPLFFGMSMMRLYRTNRDRFKLVLCGVGVFMFICAMIAFRLQFDDLYPRLGKRSTR